MWKNSQGVNNNNFIPCKFFTPMLAGGLSLESEWQQVLSGLRDFSQYSSQSCILDGLDCSSDF